MISVAVWSQVLPPGERIRVNPMSDFRLTSMALGEEVVDDKRSTIKLYRILIKEDFDEDDDEDEEDEEKEPEFEKEPVILGHLIPGKVESQLIDLIFSEEEPIEFEVTGKNAVHLVGNYIDQNPYGAGGFGDFDDEDDEDNESDYDLNEVSSDVEIDPREIDGMAQDSDDDSDDETHGKIEEVAMDSSSPASKKAPKEEKKEEKKESKKEKKEKKKESKKRAAEDDDHEDEKKQKKQKTENSSSPAKVSIVKTTKNGVKVDIRSQGSGPGAKSGQRLTMRYIGKLTNGKTFDSNTKGKAFSFVLGKGEVIKGWDEGLMGLSAGTEAVLTIPPNLAYGKRKQDGIPANSTLEFEVKILGIN